MQKQPDTIPQSEASGFRFAVITMSDKGAEGKREDTSGAALKEIFTREGFNLCHYSVIPDQIPVIIKTVLEVIENDRADLIVTTGGTGVSPTDVTPEAMDQVIQKEIPGMAEAMRAASFRITPNAVISRGRTGIRGNSLIINLPGSKKAAVENIGVILPALSHAIEKIKGSTKDCAV